MGDANVAISHIETLITALGVIIAAFTILIAIVGVFGYTSLKQAAIIAAKKIAVQSAKDEIKSYLAEQLREAAQAAVAKALHADEQAIDLSREQAMEVPRPAPRSMDNLLIRPKRAISDTDLKGSQS